MHLPFSDGNTNSTSFNITETKFFGASRLSLALSDYNMLSSIPSKPNSILDKLINEEGEIVVLLQLQWLLRQQRQAGINACTLPTCEEFTHREREREKRALKQMFEPKCKRMYKFKCNNPCNFPYCDMETGEEKLHVHANGLQH